MTAAAACLTDHEACIAALHSRLQLFKGEWWENTDLGFTIPPFLTENIRSESSLRTLANIITAYILDTPGVQPVSRVSHEREGHLFRYGCRVTTQWSEQAEITTSFPL